MVRFLGEELPHLGFTHGCLEPRVERIHGQNFKVVWYNYRTGDPSSKARRVHLSGFKMSASLKFWTSISRLVFHCGIAGPKQASVQSPAFRGS